MIRKTTPKTKSELITLGLDIGAKSKHWASESLRPGSMVT